MRIIISIFYLYLNLLSNIIINNENKTITEAYYEAIIMLQQDEMNAIKVKLEDNIIEYNNLRVAHRNYYISTYK